MRYKNNKEGEGTVRLRKIITLIAPIDTMTTTFERYRQSLWELLRRIEIKQTYVHTNVKYPTSNKVNRYR